MRDSDVVGRIGGEEFLIILPNTLEDDAVALAERLRLEIFEQSRNASLKVKQITVSIGVTDMSEEDSDFSDMVNRADVMLYEAKHSGRNQVQGYADKK